MQYPYLEDSYDRELIVESDIKANLKTKQVKTNRRTKLVVVEKLTPNSGKLVSSNHTNCRFIAKGDHLILECDEVSYEMLNGVITRVFMTAGVARQLHKSLGKVMGDKVFIHMLDLQSHFKEVLPWYSSGVYFIWLDGGVIKPSKKLDGEVEYKYDPGQEITDSDSIDVVYEGTTYSVSRNGEVHSEDILYWSHDSGKCFKVLGNGQYPYRVDVREIVGNTFLSKTGKYLHYKNIGRKHSNAVGNLFWSDYKSVVDARKELLDK